MEDGSILALYVSRLGVVSTTVAHGLNKMFVGGLPYHLKDRQVLELLNDFDSFVFFL